MPIASDPTKRFIFHLDSDRDNENAPGFLCRFLTKREYETVRGKLELAAEKQYGPEVDRAIAEVIEMGVVNWVNIDKPFNLESLVDILTPDEIAELAFGYPVQCRLAERERLFFGLPSRASSGKSAPDAATDAPSPNEAR
jgi:hypothetical protein